jgi:outer membrane protein TolC
MLEPRLFFTRKIVCLLLLLFYVSKSFGQGQQETEAVETFSLREFHEIILAYHPVISQANLYNQQARQEIRIARGGFDPRIESNYSRKKFRGVEYYNVWHSALRVPVWFNTDLRFGYEQNEGAFLNPQNRVPDAGLFYGGISVPIGQGLMIDSRRAVLRQAQELEGMLEADRISLINRTLLNATHDYWNWYFDFHQLRLMTEAQELAETRYRGIVTQVLLGNVAPIDSVEALILLQNREISVQRATVAFQNASIILSNYLWEADHTPLELRPGTIPVDYASLLRVTDVDLEGLLSNAAENHPELVRLHHEIRQIEIERRLNREMLKPLLNLNYNVLNRPTAEPDLSGAFFSQNYTLGVGFAFPLFLRQERGRLERTNIRLLRLDFDRDLRRREIRNAVLVEYNELNNTADLINRQDRLVRNNELLLEGEIIRFQAGESSIFLINTRETNLIDARSQLLSLQTRYEKAKANMLWAAGLEYLGGWN